MSTTLLEGHVLSVLEGLPAGHFHTVCTSPPYWQLRAYGTPPQTWPDGWVGELGQEDTPERFVAHLVAVFSAVRRVLRDDGTCWINLAGSYWSEPGGQNSAQGGVSEKAREANKQNGRHRLERHPVYKPLDWVDVPGLFARAMQAAGWLWRSDVVWVKPSALPESVQGTRFERCRVKVAKSGRAFGRQGDPSQVGGWQPNSGGFESVPSTEWADCPGCQRCEKTDGLVLRRGSGRPTKATERVLLFARKPGYFFDQEAVREPLSPNQQNYLSPGYRKPLEEGNGNSGGGLRDRTGWVNNPAGRNLRDYWIIGPEPLHDLHYAAYPSQLPDRCIRAGSSEWGCCPGCGAPWARVMAPPVYHQHRPSGSTEPRSDRGNKFAPDGNWGSFGTNLRREDTTLGWRPTCPPSCPGHGQPPVPTRVLDPFSGSGTTLLAANRLGRDAWGVELKPQYMALARKRVGREPLSLFATHGGEGGDDVGRGEGAAGGVERGASGDPGEPPPGLGGDEAPEAQGLTKQERHPNRTVAGFNQRWNASRRPVGDTGGILPVEERVEAQT